MHKADHCCISKMSGWMTPTGTNIQASQNIYGHCDSNIDCRDCEQFRDCGQCRVSET